MPDKPHHTRPEVQKGVSAPSNLNPNIRSRKTNRTTISVDDYVDGIRRGDRMLLSRAITLIESKLDKHRETAQAIIEGCLPYSGASIRIGITGSPGVGKSSFIETLGNQVIESGHQLAVLAIDPSSQVSHGSILGDKTRMGTLTNRKQAYIRPSPAGDSLGGVARKTRETIVLCEAAGYDTIFIETVGVGQSEIAVHSMVDFFLLLLLPGAGDELQGIKRGIVEMADVIAVNKADGDRLKLAKRARQEYQNALHLFPPKESHWTPQAVVCSTLSKLGIPEIWKLVESYMGFTQNNGYFHKRRQDQARYWLEDTIERQLKQQFYNHPLVRDRLEEIRKQVIEGTLSSFQGAEQLMQLFSESRKEA